MPPVPLLIPPSILNEYNIHIPIENDLQVAATHVFDTIVIGLPRASVNGTSCGVAVVFDERFDFQALLLPEKPENDMAFGISIAASQSGTLIVVCAPYSYSVLTLAPSGNCVGFTRSSRFSPEWLRENEYVPPIQDYQNDMQFGSSVAIDSADNVLITAPNRSPDPAAYLFQASPGTTLRILPQLSFASAGWGSSCAIYRDNVEKISYIAISAPFFDDPNHDGPDNGIIDLLSFDPLFGSTTPLLPARLPPSYTDTLVQFGMKMVLRADRLLVLSDFGRLHTFQRSGTVIERDYLFEQTFKAPSSLNVLRFHSITMIDNVIIALDSSTRLLHRFELVKEQPPLPGGVAERWQHQEIIAPVLPVGVSGEVLMEQVLCAFSCRSILYAYRAPFESSTPVVGALQCARSAECDVLIDCATFDLCVASNPTESSSTELYGSSLMPFSPPPPPPLPIPSGSSPLFSNLDSASLAPSSFLSTNLIIGLIAGGAVLLLCVVFIIFSTFLFTRCRRRRRETSTSATAKSSAGSRRNTNARRLTRQGSALRHQQPRKAQSRRNTGAQMLPAPTAGYSSATELQQLKRQNEDGGYFIPPRPRKIYSE